MSDITHPILSIVLLMSLRCMYLTIMILCFVRLLILDCPEVFNMKIITSHMVGRFLLSGRLQRPFTIASTPLLVMSGAMVALSMRYGRWGANHFMILPMPRYVLYSMAHCCPLPSTTQTTITSHTTSNLYI